MLVGVQFPAYALCVKKAHIVRHQQKREEGRGG